MTIKTPENIGVTPAGGGNVYGQDTGTAGLLNGVTPAGGSNVYVDDTGWIPYPPKTVTAGFLNVSGSPSQNALVVTSAQSTSSITARQYVYGDFVGARNINVQETMLRSDPNGTVVYDTQNNRTGFELKYTDTTLSFVNGTRTLTITPVLSSGVWTVWVAGKQFLKSSGSYQISNVEGNHWIYYDSTGTIQELVNPTNTQLETLISNANAIISYIYWDATDSKALFMDQEQHGINMSPEVHTYLHLTRHTQWLDGLALTNVVADGSGNSNASAQFGVALGDIADEDLFFSLAGVSSTTGLPVAYLSGASPVLRIATQAGYPVLNAPGGLIYYNLLSGGSWSLSALSTGNYVLYHVFATTSSLNTIFCVMGQAQYNTIDLARAGAPVELNNIVALFPAAEYKALASVIFESSNGDSNAVKGRVRSTDTGAAYIDWRSEQTYPGTSSSSVGLVGVGLTNNTLSKYIGSNQEGNSTITDDGTTVIVNTAFHFNSSGAYIGGNLADGNNLVYLTANQNNLTNLLVRNDTSGTLAQTNIAVVSNTGNLNFRVTSPGFTTVGGAGSLLVASAAHLFSNGNTAGLNVYTYDATQLTLGTADAARITISGTGTIAIPAMATAGILHNAVTTGALSSSLIVNADITTNTITAASLAQVATATLYGRGTAATGNLESITLSSDYGVAYTYSAGALKINTPQDVRTSATPGFVGLKLGADVATPTAGEPLCIASSVVGGYSSINFGALNGVSTAQNGAVVFFSGASTATTGIGFQADNLNYQLQCFQDGHTECSGGVSIGTATNPGAGNLLVGGTCQAASFNTGGSAWTFGAYTFSTPPPTNSYITLTVGGQAVTVPCYS